jgi:hypothetical protein
MLRRRHAGAKRWQSGKQQRRDGHILEESGFGGARGLALAAHQDEVKGIKQRRKDNRQAAEHCLAA